MFGPDVKSDGDKVFVIEDEDAPDAGFVVDCADPISYQIELSEEYCQT